MTMVERLRENAMYVTHIRLFIFLLPSMVNGVGIRRLLMRHLIHRLQQFYQTIVMADGNARYRYTKQLAKLTNLQTMVRVEQKVVAAERQYDLLFFVNDMRRKHQALFQSSGIHYLQHHIKTMSVELV